MGKVVVTGNLWIDGFATDKTHNYAEVFDDLDKALEAINLRTRPGLGRLLHDSIRVFRLGEEIPVEVKDVKEQKIVETVRTVVSVKE